MRSEYDDLANNVIEAIIRVTGVGTHHLHIPCLNGDDQMMVSDCVSNNEVSAAGKAVTILEKCIKNYTAASHAVLVSSGTAGLHLALICAGVGRGDEVLLPALTFVATGNAVLYCGATPHFLDTTGKGFSLSAEDLEEYLEEIAEFDRYGNAQNKNTGKVIRAILVPHIFGHIGSIKKIKYIADKYNITLVEDAAEALGSWTGEIHAGLHGMCGVISFNGNKIVTTGAGGCVITNDEEVATRIRHLAGTAKISHPYEYFHNELGFNYRMPNINAALGINQIKRLPEMLRQKQRLTRLYDIAFANVDKLDFYRHDNGSSSNYWLQTIVLKEENVEARNTIIEKAHENSLYLRPVWRLLNTLPAFIACPSMKIREAKSLMNRIINLPSSCYIGETYEE